MKVYITKYALTSGIQEKEAIDVGDGMIEVMGRYTSRYFHKGEWSMTQEAAAEKARAMKENKIKSLQKQISKIERLAF